YDGPATLGAVARDGVICAIKYAIVREDPSRDAYLDALLHEVGRDIVVSGIGERPAIAHLRDFGLKSFTSGSVCVAPRGSTRILALLKEQRYAEAHALRAAYLPLEDLRDAHGPIRVLHDAVTLAGIADMGPMLPMIANLGAGERAFVEAAAKAKNDGYTLLIGSIGTYAINPVLYKDLAYDPRRDFDLITVAVRTPNALVANPGFPPNSVAELVEYLKRNPQQVSFASSGTGSSDHLTAALFWQKTGTSGIHVPYKGGSAAHLDLISGTANVSFQNLGSITNHVRGG